VKSWIGALDVDPEGNWVAGGGGARCLWMWHLASRKVVAAMPTCGTVQAMEFCGDKLISAGAEPAIYQWKRSGKLHSRVNTKEPSTYALAHRPFAQGVDSRILVAGGTMEEIAVFYRSGSESAFSLSLNPPVVST